MTAAVWSSGSTEARRVHLAALVYELDVRGLSCSLIGKDGSVLRVTHPATGRRLMVVATPSVSGWFYLWSGGGLAPVGDPSPTAQLIATLLGRAEGVNPQR
jgi:hypothetical protein